MNERAQPNLDFSSIVEHLLDEQRDPAVTDLFEAMMDEELRMNLAPTINEKQLSAIEEKLNEHLDGAGLLGAAVAVSGKIRPTEYGGLTNGFIENGETPDEFRDFGPLLHDERGPYYLVSQKVFFCGYCEVTTDDPRPDSGHETGAHSIYVLLNPMEGDDPSGGYFSAHPGELDVFAPTDASDQRVDKMMHERYPTIAAQIDTLPEACGNDKDIFNALRKFRLEVDMSKLQHVDSEEAEQLVAYIERYITNRLELDTSMYQLLIKGDVSGTNLRSRPFIHTIDKPRNVVGFMGTVRLHQGEPQATDDEALVYYDMAVELYADSSERGGAYNILTLPLPTILRAKNLRNWPLFDQILEEVDEPYADPGIALIDTGEEFDDGDDGDDELAFTVDTLDDELAPTREQQLEGLDRRLSELMEHVSAYTAKPYDTEESVRAAIVTIGEIISVFNSFYPKEAKVLLEFEGPGVLSLPLTINPEKSNVLFSEGPINLAFDGDGLQESDLMSPKEGFYLNHCEVTAGKSEDGSDEWEISAWMFILDASVGQSVTLGKPEFSIPLVELSTRRNIAVQIDAARTHVSIPEYQRFKRCRDAIALIPTRFPDLVALPELLSSLQHSVIEADVHVTADYGDIEIINAIGETVGGDEEAVNATVDILTDIIAEHAVSVIGPMYDSEGNYLEKNGLTGTVSGVVPTTSTIPVETPMLVVSDDESDAIWYVPISTLETMYY